MRSALASVEALPLRFSVERRRGAIAPVADLANHLGFAHDTLAKLNEGGWLVHALGRTWGSLNIRSAEMQGGVFVRAGP
jgi:hypothetical protein